MHDETKTVKVEILHRAGRPHAWWARPLGWKPISPAGEESWVLDGGSLWSEQEEEAGIALLGGTSLDEGDVLNVPLSELVWLESGTCKILCGVAVEQ
jgi:hypothetical protein